MLKPVSKFTQEFIACPACGQGQHRVDHLYDYVKTKGHQTFGPWHCHACSASFRGQVDAEHNVSIETIERLPEDALSDRHFVQSYVLLSSGHEENPIYVMLRTRSMAKSLADQRTGDGNYISYYYNEHTCPTNFTRDIVLVSQNGDCDPHGVFQFIDCISEKDAVAMLQAKGIELVEENGVMNVDDHASYLFPQLTDPKPFAVGDNDTVVRFPTNVELIGADGKRGNGVYYFSGAGKELYEDTVRPDGDWYLPLSFVRIDGRLMVTCDLFKKKEKCIEELKKSGYELSGERYDAILAKARGN